MGQSSLIDSAAQLGKTSGQIKLSELRTDGYTRTHAVSGYRRVNPFEVHNGRAQDPDEAGTQHRLGDWLNYDHDQVPGGSQLSHTLVPGGVDLTWSRPGGYTRALAIVRQRVYAKDTGETEVNEAALSTNPFSSPDTSQSPGDGTSFELSLASFIGQMVAVGILAEFVDSVDVHETEHQVAYAAATGEDALTGAGGGILVGPILPTEPTINNITQDPSDFQCLAGSEIEIQINLIDCAGEVFLAEKVDSGSYGADFSVGVVNGSAQIPLNRDSSHTYTYKARYSGGSYSAEKAHFLRCDLT